MVGFDNLSVIFLKQIEKEQNQRMAEELASILINHINSVEDIDEREKSINSVERVLRIYSHKERNVAELMAEILRRKYQRNFNLE